MRNILIDARGPENQGIDFWWPYIIIIFYLFRAVHVSRTFSSVSSSKLLMASSSSSSWFCNVKYISWLPISISYMYIMTDVNHISSSRRFHLHFCTWMMDIDKLSYTYMHIYKMGPVWLHVFTAENNLMFKIVSHWKIISKGIVKMNW